MSSEMYEMYEMKLENLEFICRLWTLEPSKRHQIESLLAKIGIIAKGVPFGDDGDVYLDVGIPDNIHIAVPTESEE